MSSNIDCIIRDVWGSWSCGWDWVPSVGASGGLISIWDDKLFSVEGAVKNQRILASKLKRLSDGFIWAMANVYGLNEDRDRNPFSASLSSLTTQWFPWCMGVDFNLIRSPHEKKRGR